MVKPLNSTSITTNLHHLIIRQGCWRWSLSWNLTTFSWLVVAVSPVVSQNFGIDTNQKLWFGIFVFPFKHGYVGYQFVKFQVGSLSESTPKKREGKKCSHVICVHPAICHPFNDLDHFTPDFITEVEQACDSDTSELYPYALKPKPMAGNLKWDFGRWYSSFSNGW